MSKQKQQGEKLFSVTKDDCVWQTFRSGGPGGQNQNKVETGVRCTHPPSGAVGEARDSRSQYGNKVSAWKRMIATPAFQAWHKLECARHLGRLADIEANVERQMQSSNLVVEGRIDGRWVPIEEAVE